MAKSPRGSGRFPVIRFGGHLNMSDLVTHQGSVKINRSPARDMYRIWLDEAPLIEAKSWHKLRLRYRVTCIVVVHMADATDYPVAYGQRVSKAGVPSGREIPISGPIREVESIT